MAASNEKQNEVPVVALEQYETGCDESVENYYEAMEEEPGPVDEPAASDPWSN